MTGQQLDNNWTTTGQRTDKVYGCQPLGSDRFQSAREAKTSLFLPPGKRSISNIKPAGNKDRDK
jgi:hypothetical protein